MEITSVNSSNKLILGIISAISVFLVVRYIQNNSKNISSNNSINLIESESLEIEPVKSIVIGDSKSIFISNNNSIAKIIGTNQSENNLWKSGIQLNWLKNAVKKYPVSKNVKNVVVSIGTNGGYDSNEDITGLFNSLKNTFPNSKFYIVKGSWGWGNIKSVTESKVNKYYQKFKDLGMIVLPTPIGETTNPHTNLPVYRVVGREIEKQISI